MNTDIRTVVISAATALITSGLVALVDYTVREREMDIKMMEIAVGLLKEDPKGPLQPARVWAVDVISYYSKGGVPLSYGASVALKRTPVDVELRRMLGEIDESIRELGKRPPDAGLERMMEMMRKQGEGGQATPSVPAPEKPKAGDRR
jgi:hypothetical protein